MQISLKDYYFEIPSKHNLDLINDVVNIITIYDQGSSELRDFSGNSFYSFNNPLLIIYVRLYPVILVYFLYNRRIRLRKKSFNQIVDNLISIRNTLKVSISNDAILESAWDKLTKGRSFVDIIRSNESNDERNVQEERRRHLKFLRRLDIKDYVMLNDFYILLEKRNNLLNTKFENDNFPDIQLKELNKKLLHSANEILTNIDWNKYR